MPPAFTAATVPDTATAGQAVGMSAAASDRMSSPALRFDFGDGSGANGSAVQHVYAAAGSYTVTITATDDGGNASTATRVIQVAAAAAPLAAAPAPAPPAVNTPGPTGRQVVRATVALSWDRLGNGRTRLRKLVIEALAGPETVKLACKGQGCRKTANRTITKHGLTLNLTRYVKGMTLRPKTRLTIDVTRPGFVARTIDYTMVNKRDPKKFTRCLAPDAKKTTAC